jgi:hypothetical protein
MVSVRLSVRPGADLDFKTSTDGQDQVLKSRSLDGRRGGRRRMGGGPGWLEWHSHGLPSLVRKKGGNEKRVVYIGGRFLYSCVLLRFWEHPRAHVLECPSLRRTHCTGTSPTTFKCFVSIHHLSCMECWWVLIHSGLGGNLHMVLGPLCSTIRCGSLLIRPFMCDGH